MEEKLKELMSDLFKMKKEEISDSLTMKDTDVWDSLKHMELIVSIEETFNVQLSADEIVAMQDVKAIKIILAEKRLAA